jgi:hypothetical protein
MGNHDSYSDSRLLKAVRMPIVNTPNSISRSLPESHWWRMKMTAGRCDAGTHRDTPVCRLRLSNRIAR